MKTKTVPGFDNSNGRPIMVYHTFEATPDGQLSHKTDGVLRAVVPPEGWKDYCAQYPEAEDICVALYRGKAPAPVNVTAEYDAPPVEETATREILVTEKESEIIGNILTGESKVISQDEYARFLDWQAANGHNSQIADPLGEVGASTTPDA